MNACVTAGATEERNALHNPDSVGVGPQLRCYLFVPPPLNQRPVCGSEHPCKKEKMASAFIYDLGIFSSASRRGGNVRSVVPPPDACRSPPSAHSMLRVAPPRLILTGWSTREGYRLTSPPPPPHTLLPTPPSPHPSMAGREPLGASLPRELLVIPRARCSRRRWSLNSFLPVRRLSNEGSVYFRHHGVLLI